MSLLVAALLASISVETDPVFWVGTVPNGPAADFNVDVTVGSFRLGVLGWSGRWSGAFARATVLPADFSEPDWSVRWSGAGVEAQYQFRFGLERGGLSPGLRVQWSRFDFDQGAAPLATANHLVVTPQVGFQWFPFSKIGLYVLPWAGVQLPVAGTRDVAIGESRRETRRVLPVITVHLGWAF